MVHRYISADFTNLCACRRIQHVCTYIYISSRYCCAYVFTHICIYVFLDLCFYVYLLYIYIYCVYMYVCIYIYTRIHTDR